MTIQINHGRFQTAHQVFLQYMQERAGGIPFTNFQHPFLVKDETEYKRIAYGKAKAVLQLDKWSSWVDRIPSRIIEATKAACDPKVSENLLYHRHGFENSSEAPLYKVRSESEICGLATQLYSFFQGGPSTPYAFGPRFDEFADYLRQNRLPCNWSFLAYLAFLLDVDRYFPIRPTQFDLVLKYYGVGKTISGYVTWERYALLLEVAEILKSKLAIYGPATALEIQSYMWVISYLKEIWEHPSIEAPDFERALKEREQRARERERIGLRGEQFVYEQEREKLEQAGRPDLAQQVQLVAMSDDAAGFDILSFEPDGTELHIEVKTTASSPEQDPGFWLSENERAQAEKDSRWRIYRVWNINASPTHQNLGNIVQQPCEEWELNISTWSVRRR